MLAVENIAWQINLTSSSLLRSEGTQQTRLYFFAPQQRQSMAGYCFLTPGLPAEIAVMAEIESQLPPPSLTLDCQDQG
jgi:hypothetical protein